MAGVHPDQLEIWGMRNRNEINWRDKRPDVVSVSQQFRNYRHTEIGFGKIHGASSPVPTNQGSGSRGEGSGPDGFQASMAREMETSPPLQRKARAVKRRPKPHHLINVPQRKMIEISHRFRYKKTSDETVPRNP
jgi:hypothetical protein